MDKDVDIVSDILLDKAKEEVMIGDVMVYANTHNSILELTKPLIRCDDDIARIAAVIKALRQFDDAWREHREQLIRKLNERHREEKTIPSVG